MTSISNTDVIAEYAKACKAGQKEHRESLQKGISPYPEVLDDLLPDNSANSSVDIGLVEIPIHRIVGTKSAGRILAFSRSFLPLLPPETEFASKWINLCDAHLSDEGIHDPIECFEYLGNFYVQEGNKRVSVLRYFHGTKIPANVRRILPAEDDTCPRVKTYHEFLEFYKLTGLYDLQYTTPGSYAKLLERLNCSPKEKWTAEQRRRFQSGYYYFTEALTAVGGQNLPQPEDALLMWLEVYPFSKLTEMSAAERKKTITQLWINLLAASEPEPVVKTEPPTDKGVIKQLLSGTSHLNIAFIHMYDRQTSNWTCAHEVGREHLETVFGKAVTTHAYSNANDPEIAMELLEEAIKNGAEVVFTTAPQLIGPCMKTSVKYPKVRFFNCSVHQPYASVETYYSRIYEGKFITGAIAGAMCHDGKIGYVGSYPIHGVPASINAFALGAQLTNPDAKIYLKWSCTQGNPTQEFIDTGIQVISNRDTPTQAHLVNEYGTYFFDQSGQLVPLGSPTWIWGQFYENMIRSLLNGSWESEKAGKSVNLWWGMSSGVIDVTLSPELPEGIRVLAQLLKENICSGNLDPFCRKIRDQQGNIRNDGTQVFSPGELIHMDWLCDNVEGSFPKYENILPISRPMVDLLGIDPSSDEGKSL